MRATHTTHPCDNNSAPFVCVSIRASRDGTTYSDMLRCVGDKTRLVFVIRKDEYVFGAFISAGIELPDDPRGENKYLCDGWHFSLAGHFNKPTMMGQCGRTLRVAGREGIVPVVSVFRAKLVIGCYLWLGYKGLWWGYECSAAATDMRRCRQVISFEDDVPEGYVGVRDEDGDAVFGGSPDFMADDLEVLTVVRK